MRSGFAKSLFKKANILLLTILLINSVVFLPSSESLAAAYVPPAAITSDDIIAVNENQMISYPHYGTPVFSEPGESFVAEVRIPDNSRGTNGWTAWVENEYQKWDCTVGTITYGDTNVYLEMKRGYKVPIALPSNVTPELLTLVICHSSGLELRSPMSVSVVPTLDTSFYIADVTDTHLGWDKELTPGNYDNAPSAYGRMCKALSITGARFLSHTGDISLYPLKSRADGIREGIIDTQLQHSGYSLPFIVVAGNHEYDTYVYPKASITEGDRLGNFNGNDFDRYFGMRSAIMKMGSFAVAKHDYYAYWGDKPLRNAMVANWNALTGANYRLLLEHTNSGSSGTPLFQANPAPTPYPNLELKGHDHSWSVNQTSPYRVLSAGGGAPWTAGSGALLSFNYNGTSWSSPQAASWGISNKTSFINRTNKDLMISDTYAKNNNGTVTSNTCTIKNDINFNFYDGRVRFVMSPGNYNLTNATKLAQYTSADGSKTIVLAKVNIPASSSIDVSIAPVSPKTYLLSDSFNTYPTGLMPSGWAINSSGGSVVVVEVPNAIEKSLMLTKSSENPGFSATHKKLLIPQSSGVINYDTWVMTPDGQSKKFLMLWDQSQTRIPFKITLDHDKIMMNDTAFIQSFVPGKWLHIVAKLNLDTKKTDLTIDDVNKGTFDFYDTGATSVGEVLFSIHPGFMGTLYVNYFGITK